ncbi:DMT family transporter [Pseudotabrizicola sediminis]|uniref:DMT family transporter n=1 Tax=Pseudotabrizicola sediminis TaxID=2486418 RepID=A0ABY2KJ05_9RHOB|nr:DMT family transporter [Pseudotabrizicola sediminis]TGD42382.1 DMT family transporter [Pseudotabrizicola sediminis]
MTAPIPTPTRSDWLSILALGLIWGGTFIVISLALRGYGPVTVACARTTFGALTVLGLLWLTGRQLPRDARVWRSAVPIGLLSTALPFFLLSWGQQSVPSAFAGLSMAAVPLFVLPLAHRYSDEPLTTRRAIGFALGFAGVLVLLGPAAAAGDGATLAQLACLGAALSYAVSSVLTRRCPPVDPVALAAATLMVGAVVLIPAMLLVEGVPAWAGTVPGVAIIFLGLVPTAFAALLRVTVIRSAGSGFMTLTNYQVPLWSMGFGVVFLAETLPSTFFAALGLILTGLAISQSRRRKMATAS